MIRIGRAARRRQDAGQSAVLVSLLMMIVVMLIAFTTNIGKLVTERIAMQNTADTAAYAGAATQAGILNDMRAINQEIWTTLVQARSQLQLSDTFPAFGAETPCSVCAGFNNPTGCPMQLKNAEAEAVIMEAQATVMGLSGAIQALNSTMGMRSMGAAMMTAQANYPGVQMQPLGGSMSSAPIKQDEVSLDYRGWGYQNVPCKGCGSCYAPVGSPLINKTKVKSWYFRDPDQQGEVMFAVKVAGTPNSPFIDGGFLGSFFGERNQLSTYAAALPVKGKMGTIKGGKFSEAYEDKWDSTGPMSINDQNPQAISYAMSLQPSMVLFGSYQDYAVRFVGVFESKAAFVGGDALRDAVPDPDKMKH